MKGATTNRRVTTRIIAGLALVALIVHLLTIHRYGYFRDELYYIACACHLDFGYVDLGTAVRVLAANRTDFVRELIVRVADFSCAGKRAYHRFDGNSHTRAGRPSVGDCSRMHEHAREPVFPRRRQLLFAQCL